jgi:hypothetical protein
VRAPKERLGGRVVSGQEAEAEAEAEWGEARMRDNVLPDAVPDILVLTEPIAPEQLRALVARFFLDMVKFVADIEAGVIAVGGELHADAEQVLLERGSRQHDVWGGNYYPGRGAEACVEFTALISIRPSQENGSMEIEDPSVRERVRDLVHRLVGRGGESPA